MKNREVLIKAAQAMPLTPGCYLFKDRDGNVLYVGKSKCLRKRVASYFSGQKEPKIEKMVRIAASVTHEPTDTDIEAMLLEYRLIKKYQPPFNAKMRKDRQSWYIQVDLRPPYPSLQITDETDGDAVLSIGPFPKEESAVFALEIVGNFWRLPTCGQTFKDKKGKKAKKATCLRFQIKQCSAPCGGEIEHEAYRGAIKGACAFLRGESDSALRELQAKMLTATEALDFEKAAVLRDKHDALHRLSRHLKHMPPPLKGKEFCVFVKSRHEECFILTHVKDECVQAYMRFDSLADFLQGHTQSLSHVHANTLNGYATPNTSEGLTLINAILEIDAHRSFIEISPKHGSYCNSDELAQFLIMSLNGELP